MRTVRSTAIVGIVLGSDSDLPIMKSAAELLDEWNVPYELTVASAHRTPHRAIQYAATAKQRGLQILIAAAGGAAHLPGVMAALTPLPVIGVPIKTSKLDGLDSLLSIAQMPDGIPVATVAINSAKNAALLACRILGIFQPRIASKMEKYRAHLKKSVESKAKRLDLEGYKKYLKRLS
ncbi:MAG: 5-(carboxyamino)imidazole ribonucleotide mutase [Elusimicrobia bacterium]|nr:5-(carboxyamino)imidazole ribonucleotide mutase [Elusimicrobiota bacterium]MBI4217809.1 5-(carboxyamino)imidazole ribonucleotide mutase [Elusimicrobiota bacterium]